MPNEDLSDLLAIARTKNLTEDTIGRAIERIRFLVWACYGLGVAIVAVAVWVTVVNTSLKVIDANTAQIRAHETYNQSNTLTIQALQSIDKILRADIDTTRSELKDLQPKVNEMWFMKEHGISNKEDFVLRHGYAAPTGPTGDPDKPRP